MVNGSPAIGRLVFGIPAYNEEKHLGAVLGEVTARPGDCFVIVVDDGSRDGTWDVASGWPGVCAIRHPENRGMAAAQITLLKEFLARFKCPDDILILIHGDGAMDLSEADRFLERFRETDADVIFGSRLLWWWRNLKVRGLFRTFCDMGATVLENVAFRTWLTCYGSGFRAWKRRGLERLDLESTMSTGASFDVEIVARALFAGLAVAEIPIRALPRLRSSSYLLTSYACCVTRVIARMGVLRWTHHGKPGPHPVGASPGAMPSRHHPRWHGAHRPAR
jgi:dolichol-phosphate mannosyltransferase